MNKVIFSSHQKELLTNVRRFVTDYFSKAEGKGIFKGGHGFDHTQRVTGMAVLLAGMEGYDPFLCALAALLHDLGRASLRPAASNWRHGQLSKEISEEIINSLNLSSDDTTLIKNAIEDHPKLNKDVRESILVKILMDSDRLDVIGAIGPVRSAAHRWKLPLYSSNIKSGTDETQIKTIYQDFAVRGLATYQFLWTKSARKLAEPKIKFQKKFIEEYRRELSFAHQSFDNLDI